MKIADYMQKTVTTVTPQDPVNKVVKIIFNLGITGVPVVDQKKLVGIVTEEDIMQKLFPSVSEYMNDKVSARNFDAMESNISHLMNMPISDIMTSKVTSLSPTTPLMKAQSTMLVNNFTHIPVIDDKKTLVGMISQGDVFNALVENEVPYDNSEEYYQWLSYHWDMVVPWEERLSSEIPSLDKLFKKHKTKSIIDVFCGTGEHDIALAKKGYSVLGLNKGSLMHRKAVDKYANLPSNLTHLLSFKCGQYQEMIEEIAYSPDAIVFLGNALGHLVDEYKQLLKLCAKKLQANKGFVVLQLTNIDKIISQSDRLQEMTIAPSKLTNTSEYAFIQFFDPPHKGESHATLNMAILGRSNKRWQHKSINSTPIVYFTPEIIKDLLKKVGFSNVEIFGSKYHAPLFEDKFNPKTHDWINVVAKI